MLRVASMHRIVIHCIDISIHIDESLHPYFYWSVYDQISLLATEVPSKVWKSSKIGHTQRPLGKGCFNPILR